MCAGVLACVLWLEVADSRLEADVWLRTKQSLMFFGLEDFAFLFLFLFLFSFDENYTHVHSIKYFVPEFLGKFLLL